MEKIILPGNPYALVKNNVVTDVVFMQAYSEDEIKETLLKYDYDKVVKCSEYGRMIYVDEVLVRDTFSGVKPFDSWYLNEDTATWEAPVEYPKDGHLYQWFEDKMSWGLCDSCFNCTDSSHLHNVRETIDAY